MEEVGHSIEQKIHAADTDLNDLDRVSYELEQMVLGACFETGEKLSSNSLSGWANTYCGC